MVSNMRFPSVELVLVAIMVSQVSTQPVPAVPAFTADLQGVRRSDSMCFCIASSLSLWIVSVDGRIARAVRWINH